MKKIRGTDMYVLCLLRRAARAGIDGSAAGPVPFTPAMIFRWLGQIRIQTLPAMIVPSIPPMWMNIERAVMIWSSPKAAATMSTRPVTIPAYSFLAKTLERPRS